MSDKIEVAVVGCGVVGLSIARSLALAGREVIVLEAESGPGNGISSRNSEVIHAGIYYDPGSQKADLCVRGRQLLYQYCKDRVPHRRIGKLIVATEPDEIAALERLGQRARDNGVSDLRWLERAGVAALLSPSTGIIDSHALMMAYQADAEAAGATFAFHAPVTAAAATSRGVDLIVGGADDFVLRCDWVINSAGLSACDVATSISGLPPDRIPGSYLCKGSYFSLAGASPFSHLVYPMPNQAGLGVHLTLDMGGRAKFGPDTEWIEAVDFAVDPDRAAPFYDLIRRYWPGLPSGALAPDYSGIRPKICRPGEPAADFRIDGPDRHGVPGLVNLFGIESPGLTASLALGEVVASIVRGETSPA
jgi:L-2-hydroxyglutarate oxidase LhgO